MNQQSKRWWPRVRWEVAKATITWAVTGILSVVFLVISPYLPVIGKYMASAIPLSIPLWALLSAGVFLLTLMIVAWLEISSLKRKSIELRNQNSTLRAPRAAVFHWKGRDWVIGPDFWSNYEWNPASTILGSLLNSCVREPHCPDCKRDLSEHLSKDKCECGYRFGLGLATGGASGDPMQTLKAEVYREAQAAARRGELTRPGTTPITTPKR